MSRERVYGVRIFPPPEEIEMPLEPHEVSKVFEVSRESLRRWGKAGEIIKPPRTGRGGGRQFGSREAHSVLERMQKSRDRGDHPVFPWLEEIDLSKIGETFETPTGHRVEIIDLGSKPPITTK